MTEYFKDIEQAHNLTEIREILYLIRKKYNYSLLIVHELLDAYQGKHHQVGQRFKKLKRTILEELEVLFANR